MKLIDADALKESIDEHVYIVHHGFNETEYGCTQYGIHQIIDEQPTIDAVPVIRCKDCKHRPHKDEHGHVVPPEEDEELSLCPCVDDNDWYYNYIPMADWYCANAEPKEKET